MKHTTKHVLVILSAVLSLLVITSCPEPHVHTWDNGIVTVPYCFQDGEITYTCTTCGEKKVEKVSAVGHHADYLSEWDVRDVNGSKIQYKRCPICHSDDSEHLFGEEFAHLFNVNNLGALTPKDLGAISGSIMIPTIVGEKVVTSIANYAFDDADELQSVEIPLSVKTIGNYAFRGCTGLTNITIPNEVTSVGESAFYRCNGLTSVTIPASVSSIGLHAFGDTYKSSITTVVFEYGTVSIPYKAFNDCISLVSVSIPDTVTTIGGYAFNRCLSLDNISLPEGLERIEDDAFYSCSFSSITIPSSVSHIGKAAFWNCNNLTTVTYENDLTHWISSTPQSPAIRSGCTIVCTDGEIYGPY